MNNIYKVILFLGCNLLVLPNDLLAYTHTTGRNFNYTVKNHESDSVKDYPVIIQLTDKASQEQWQVIDQHGHVIPSQLDDLNGDGFFDELFCLVQLPPRHEAKLKIRKNHTAPIVPIQPRVRAQMYLKTKDSLVSLTEYSSFKDDMYYQLYHHGPAFESELVAYRLYSDRKQTVDIYGKKMPRLELEACKWYPNDEQLALGFGDDVLRVQGSVGVGTLKPWDATKKKAVHIEPMQKRTLRIVSRGPLRTIVEIEVLGWECQGQTVDMLSRFTLNGGSRTVMAEHFLKAAHPQALQLVTGVQKLPNDTCYVDGKGLLAAWGTDWPVNDSIKYAKETVGLSVFVPSVYCGEAVVDKSNHLYFVKPDANGYLKYYFTFYSAKEQLPIRKAEDFFEWIVAVYAEPKIIKD